MRSLPKEGGFEAFLENMSMAGMRGEVLVYRDLSPLPDDLPEWGVSPCGSGYTRRPFGIES